MKTARAGRPVSLWNLVVPFLRLRWRNLWVWVAAILIVPVTAAAFYLWHVQQFENSRAASGIVVVPFRGDGQGSEPWFAGGLSQDIAGALGRIHGLRVLAVEPGEPPAGDVAAKTGATAVLRGTVRKSAGRVRVTARIERADGGIEVWSRTFDRPVRGESTIPREIADAVAGMLRTRPPAVPGHQAAPAAYDAYLEGRELFPRLDPDSLSEAAAHFKDATTIDPNFAEAWAWLAIANARLADACQARPNDAMAAARDAAERAVTLGGGLGEAHCARGIVRLEYDWNWDGAKEELDRAVELSPAWAAPLYWRSRWFDAMGRAAEAQADRERAKKLDPPSAGLPADPFAACLDGRYSGVQKDTDQEGVLLDEATDLRAKSFVPAMAFALMARNLQDWNGLFQWLDKAHDEHSTQLPYLRTMPGAPRGDPRFRALVDEMHFPAAQ